MAEPQELDPVLADLAGRLEAAMEAADLPQADPGFERPRQPEHGDWASTVALRLAKPAQRAPRDIAQLLVDHLDLPDAVSEVEIAGPGFINFRFSHTYFEDLVRRVVREADRYGTREKDGDREHVNIEFVSANPTGPLHVGAGRWAATGDAIAALLEAEGHSVHREYYLNDAGEQIRRFGESVVLAHRGEDLTDDHYQGEYVAEIAAELSQQHGKQLFEPQDGDDQLAAAAAGVQHTGGLLDGGEGDDEPASTGDPRVHPGVAARIGDLAVRAMRDHIAATLRSMGVEYDVWFSEKSLHDTGAIQDAIDDLAQRGHTYEADGAVFLATSEFGDDKDRVLVRSDGRPTYFAADCAYVRDKWSRGYDRLIYLLGADHHGYVARLRAAAEATGIASDRLEIVIGQMVNLLRGGEPVRMSKRAGTFVTLEEVLEEVGGDVTRYHFLRQGLDTTIDFDLETVVEQSMENPVYYVQYAHARINSLVRTADDRGFEHGRLDDADLSRLEHPAELDLLRAMSALPEVVADAAELRATQRVTRYAEDLAATFHRFYTECRVLVDDEALARARYWLAVAARQVLANTLGFLRVSAPERM
ncbi:MAG: arginine--tRNA ligase [Nitriliruptorales bacterium]|nr:arginine--tRNA ligase [Nitriliruptorales bacterium]